MLINGNKCLSQQAPLEGNSVKIMALISEIISAASAGRKMRQCELQDLRLSHVPA